MGIGLIVAGASLAISIGLTAFTLLSQKNQGEDNLSPQSLDSFQITQAREGSIPPIVYGTVRIAGNIIYYGNLVTVEITQETPGGKGIGGGGGKVTTGFEYYLDIWQSICVGKIQLLSYFVDNKVEELRYSDVLFNDGENGVFPTEPGQNANAIKGISHIFHKRLFLGENSTNVQTIHFVVKRILNTGLTNENLASGSNPAAIILDLLLQSGVSTTKIDLTAFQVAANFWSSKGYGLNLVFDKQETFGEAINKVLSFVDGTVFITKNGKISIYAFNPTDTSVATFSEDDFDNFFIRRITEDQLPNDFRGTYTDKDQEFSKRTVVTQNQALIDKVGERTTESIDLSGFNTLEVSSKRLTEQMKILTYPAAEVEFSAISLFASTLIPGQIITINFASLGIENLSCRVTKVVHENIDKNTVGVSAIQVVETIFDDVFTDLGGTLQVPVNFSLEPLEHIKFFELPFTTSTGFEPSFLVLAARKTGIETQYTALVSTEETQNFIVFDNFTTFSQRGTLTSAYTIGKTYDNEIGIEYTTTNFDPSFSTISDSQLFSIPRFAVIGEEIIFFKEVISVSPNNFKLLGCIRGGLGTAKQSHSNGVEIWIVNVGDNILKGMQNSSFFVKLLPRFRNQVVLAEDVDAIEVETTNKAKKPRNPSRIEATRTGNTVEIQLYPNTPGISGNGQVILSNTPTQIPPYPFLGDFVASYDSVTEIKTTDYFLFDRAGAFSFTVKSRLNGFVSAGLTINIGSGDGFYAKNN